MNYSELMVQVVIASIGTVGLVEVIKNFLKTEKKWIFSLIMIPLCVGTYFAAVCLPSWVIGGIITIGVTQLCYQTIIQTIQNVVKVVTNRVSGEKGEVKNEQ